MDYLKNKFYKNYNQISRYNTAPCFYHILDNKYLTGFSKRLKDTTPYIIHVVKRSDTFDSLALCRAPAGTLPAEHVPEQERRFPD